MSRAILLTAKPRTGKSTAIEKIINEIGKDNYVGFFTKEIRNEQNERTGFEIITSDGKIGRLSSIFSTSPIRHSRYGVELEFFENEALPLIENADSSKVVVIDEIGPMQMYSDSFKRILLNYIDSDNRVVIGTIFYDSYEWIDDFKKNPNVELMEVTLENRDDIPKMVLDKVGDVLDE
jgi:nucleoside-triphosphatase